MILRHELRHLAFAACIFLGLSGSNVGTNLAVAKRIYEESGAPGRNTP